MTSPVSDAMIEAGAKAFRQAHQCTCYPDAADWECVDAAKRIYASMKAKEEASNQSPADEVERDELVSILSERQDQDFDGECHLTNAEADRLLTFLREAIRNGDEGMRQQGQAEGFAAAVEWLRDRSAMKPPATLWHAASLLADQLEQSRIPRPNR